MAGIILLLEAFDAATDAGCDTWEFAVEFDRLIEVGLCATHLRWLVAKGFVEQRQELTISGDSRRFFRPVGSPQFGAHSCFVLTATGAEWCSNEFGRPADSMPVTAHISADGQIAPHWDEMHHALFVGRDLVKQFRVPAPNQELILSVFEEEHWPDRIDDPLPPTRLGDAKRRLHAAINALNRSQVRRRIHFYGDGTGLAIGWQLLVDPSPTDAAGNGPGAPQTSCPCRSTKTRLRPEPDQIDG